MSMFMLVVSVKMRNIAFLQPQAGSDDTTINYFSHIIVERWGLMLFNCDGLILVTYSFNGGMASGDERPDFVANPYFLPSIPFIPTISLDKTNMECEQCGMVSLKKVGVYLGVKEKPSAGSKRRNYNNASLRCDGCDKRGVISLILDHGNPPREHHCRETSGQEIHVDLVGREYKNMIDGEEVTITNLKAKFVPRG
ncbi:hypothetical protein CK203_090307 [Vitis vinifera]|uniref:Uncharacterized protein n=1 Tax=Vitis vinifera TaxID=29760 RepID=A0A438DSA6_VITVI|nr:hypothetical protein CK203_090307 [Vitis vinifera]